MWKFADNKNPNVIIAKKKQNAAMAASSLRLKLRRNSWVRGKWYIAEIFISVWLFFCSTDSFRTQYSVHGGGGDSSRIAGSLAARIESFDLYVLHRLWVTRNADG